MQFQNNKGHADEMEQTSFQSSFSDSMGKDQSQSVVNKQPLISFNYHPGFLCFFQDYVKKQDWTFYQCYQKVFQSHHQMMKIRTSTADILNSPDLDKMQKMTQLMHRAQKDKKFIYYLRREEGGLDANVLVRQDRKIQQIKNLQEQLQKLQKIKQKVISQKKKQFQQKQIQRCKQQQKEIQDLMTEKERRADLVRTIQREAQEKRRLKAIQKQKRIATGTQSGKCAIM